MKNRLPESYIRLKKYSNLIEEICKDINLRGFGYEPGVSFYSPSGHSLELPEWFLEKLYDFISNGCDS